MGDRTWRFRQNLLSYVLSMSKAQKTMHSAISAFFLFIHVLIFFLFKFIKFLHANTLQTEKLKLSWASMVDAVIDAKSYALIFLVV